MSNAKQPGSKELGVTIAPPKAQQAGNNIEAVAAAVNVEMQRVFGPHELEIRRLQKERGHKFCPRCNREPYKPGKGCVGCGLDYRDPQGRAVLG